MKRRREMEILMLSLQKHGLVDSDNKKHIFEIAIKEGLRQIKVEKFNTKN